MSKPILCVDFDGVIHSYKSGWKGADVIPDPPVDGFFDWAQRAAPHFKLVIYSSRTRQPGGIAAMRSWLVAQFSTYCQEYGSEAFADVEPGPEANVKLKTGHFDVFQIFFAHEKPPAFLTIDDRAWCFDGSWPEPKLLLMYKTWQQMTPEDYEAFRGWSQKPNGDVVLTMTLEDWQNLLMALGYAGGAAMKNGERSLLYKQMELLNRINHGNSNYTPYAIPERHESDPALRLGE